MLFPTVEYALFFLTVLAVAWSLYRFPRTHKAFLLLASYVFYGFWNWTYLPLLFGISLFSGLTAQRIQKSESARARKLWLVAGVVVCLATLGYFKYTGFLLTNMLAVVGGGLRLRRASLSTRRCCRWAFRSLSFMPSRCLVIAIAARSRSR